MNIRDDDQVSAVAPVVETEAELAADVAGNGSAPEDGVEALDTDEQSGNGAA
jgi:hypothetical protein